MAPDGHLYYSVLSGSIENVDLLIEAYGCDVDLQNNAGDTPLHLAVQITNQDTRHAIVSALVEIAGAIDSYVIPIFTNWVVRPDPMALISIRTTNKAGQTPNALARIHFPNDTVVISLTTPAARQTSDFLSKDDIASGESIGGSFLRADHPYKDGEGDSGSGSD